MVSGICKWAKRARRGFPFQDAAEVVPQHFALVGKAQGDEAGQQLRDPGLG
jgi:hypothetical protein